MKLFKFLSFSVLLIISANIKTIAQSEEEYKKAVEYFTEANKLKQEYKLDAASEQFNSAALLFKKNGYSGNYIQCKYSFGDILIQKNKFDEASEVFNEIDTISINKYGADNKFQLNILFGKGTVAFYKNYIDDALNFYLKSLQLNTKHTGGNNYFGSVLYSSIGNIYSVKGDYNTAIEYYQKDLDLKSKIMGADNPAISVSYNNIGLAYKNKGDYDKALEFINIAIDISSKFNNGYNKENANYLGNAGSIYFEKGQYELALDFTTKALNINKTIFGESHKSVADNLNTTGVILNKKGMYKEALVAFKDAYEIQKTVLGIEHPDIAMTCNNIGFILEMEGKYESSLSFYNEAIKIKTKFFGPFHPDLAVYYNNMGINYYNRGMLNESLESYSKAEQILAKKYGNKFPGLVKIYANKADIYRNKGMINESLNYYQKSLTANINNFNPDSTDFYTNPTLKNYYDLDKLLISLQGKAIILNNLFEKNSDEKSLEAAYKTYILCDSVIELYNRSSVKESDKIALNNRTKEVYEDAIITSMEMAYNKKDEKDKQIFYDKAFYFSEKNKAGILSQAITASSAKKFAGIPDVVLDKEKFYQEQIAQLEKQIIESADISLTSIYKNLLFDYNNKLIQLNTEIEKNYPKYFESKYKTTIIDIKSIQKRLEKNTALRSYFIAKEQIFIFTVTKENINIFSSKKPSDFDEQVKTLIKYTTSGLKSDFPKYIKSANDIYKILFPDIIPAEVTKITVVPDGIIGLVPFDALFTEQFTGDILNFKDYPFLIKKYQINYFYSAGLFLKSKENIYTSSNNGLIGYAPVFDNLQSNNIAGFEASSLPGTQEELEKINNIFTDKYFISKALFRNEATEKNIKTEKLKDYKYIHVATHGIVNTEFPELSGLIMYPEKDIEDNILYSGEIYNLVLNADLVVLSACQTGIGKVSKSEGIIGLSRALLYSGANNVIVSLWKVSDASTTNLMIDFYKNIIDYNFDYSESLHNAKIKMINEGGTYAHPYFWSAFILIGD